jgi:2-hydroxychromene-2-carboxylate isomerase
MAGQSVSQVTQQSGAASSNPSGIKRWALSRLMTHAISAERQARQRVRKEARRRKDGRPHLVEYFHQVDDGYSHLAMQALAKLAGAYHIDLVVHLVPGLRDDNIPEPDLLLDMSRWDSAAIAPHYGLAFPEAPSAPAKRLSDLALSILAALEVNSVITVGVEVSDSLWRGDEAGLKAIAAEYGTASEASVAARLKAGAARRAELKHYSGAMFYYEGEWYWGIDRLRHLEARLHALSALRSGGAALVAPKPGNLTTFPSGASEMTLEYYVSLRSPYTAISWEPTLALAKASGITLDVRPVLPMVMRGVPATFQKALYVWKDVAREARDLDVEYGDFYDPIGKPVQQGLSLYMWALGKSRGNDFFGAFLKAAFAKGVNTNSRAGMRQVVEMAGLDWDEAQNHLEDNTWQCSVEENRKTMYALGIWGVPSYRLLDRSGYSVLSVWGQDRLWLVARKIVEHA